jgi:hypothetical protein
MVRTDRQGLFYADNLVDSVLSFNNSQTWSVSSGTGSAATNTEQAYSGERGLKIINTDPANDIRVSFSNQSTSIPEGRNYGVSCRFYKTLGEEISGLVKIYQNAVLLSNEAFTLDATDDTDKWVAFATDVNFALSKGDDITFQFQIDGFVTAQPSIVVYVDGLHLYAKDRGQEAPPPYTTPTGNGINDLLQASGWGYYTDAESSPATQTFNTTPAILQIDGAGSTTDESQLPLEIRGFASLWDTTNDKVLAVNAGDAYDLRVDFEVTGETGSPTDIIIQLDTSGGGSPTIPIVTKYAGTGKGTPYIVSVAFGVFSGSTFMSNGGQIFISTDAGSITVASRGIFITRVHKAN